MFLLLFACIFAVVWQQTFEGWAGPHAHTVVANCACGLLGGAAMACCRRLQDKNWT